MIYKWLFLSLLLHVPLFGMFEAEPEKFFNDALHFIYSIIPQKNPHTFSKKLKDYLKEANASKKDKKKLKKRLAYLAQPTFYTVKTLAGVTLLDCASNLHRSTLAWVDTLDNTFSINSTKKPQETIRISDHTHAISCLALSLNQKYLVSGSKGHDAIKIWQLKKHISCLTTLDYSGYLQSTNIDSDSSDFITVARFLPHKKNSLICTDSAGKVVLITLDSHKKNPIKVTVLKVEPTPYWLIRFSPNNQFMIASNPHTIIVWKTKDWSIHSEFSINKPWELDTLCTNIFFLIIKKSNARTKSDHHEINVIKISKSFDTIEREAKFCVKNGVLDFNAHDIPFVLESGDQPKLHYSEAPCAFLLPDWTQKNSYAQHGSTPSILSAVLIDQKGPYKIATIYVPEPLNFKKLYLHMAIRKALVERNSEALRTLRKNKLIEKYGTPELLRGYIDNALKKIDSCNN